MVAASLRTRLLYPGCWGSRGNRCRNWPWAKPQPPRLADKSEQGLHHRQGDQFGVGDLRADPGRRPPRRPFWCGLQQVIGTGVECGGEGVQVGVHEGLEARRWVSNADLGTFALLPAQQARPHPLELIVQVRLSRLPSAFRTAVRDRWSHRGCHSWSPGC
jgi:hypothetical protein